MDCSVTPHIDWSNTVGQSQGSCGSDYSNESETPYYVNNILEVPMTIRETKHFFAPQRKNIKSFGGSIVRSIRGQKLWFRPNGKNIQQMEWLLDEVGKSQSDYIMFMLHSSELMPGGSPTFKTEEQINKLYTDLEYLFRKANHFEGITLREYGKQYKDRK